MDSGIFSYYMSEDDCIIQEMPRKYRFGKYTIQTDLKTSFSCSTKQLNGCAIFGLAVNVMTGESENLPEIILSSCSNLIDVIEYEKKIGGKYILIYREKERYYILGDATCSIPIFYNTDGTFICTSNYQYIVKRNSYHPDPVLQEIRNCGEISQAMPYDLTVYREIKQLIPNHYLDIGKKKAERFVNYFSPQKQLTLQQVTETVTPMIERITDYYKRQFPIYCPITAGRDSRVVLSFLCSDGTKPMCYTIRHPEHTEEVQDLVIPRQLCIKCGFPYEQIQDVKITDELKNKMDSMLGEGVYSLRTLQIAQTIRSHYPNCAVINGDIIGQVGKCSLHRDIPLWFATPNYFRCKLHNYSKESKKQLRLWLDEIKNSGECVNTFDLFSIENRMGRWAAQENLIYNLLGQVYLNIFNSRSIIYLWTAISRKERKKSQIHIKLIEKKMSKLLEMPFESDENLIIRLSKANGLTYLLSSYAKYYLECLKFKRGK